MTDPLIIPTDTVGDIKAQRDRARATAIELEAELARLHEVLSCLADQWEDLDGIPDHHVNAVRALISDDNLYIDEPAVQEPPC